MSLKFQFSIADEKLWLLPFPEHKDTLTQTQIPHTDTDTATHSHRYRHTDNTDTPTHRYDPCPHTDTHTETHADTSTRACKYTCLHTLNFKLSLQRPLPSCSNLETTLLPVCCGDVILGSLSSASSLWMSPPVLCVVACLLDTIA